MALNKEQEAVAWEITDYAMNTGRHFFEKLERAEYWRDMWQTRQKEPVNIRPLYASPQPEAVITDEMRSEALRLLKARDERDDKVQEIIEDLREIVLLMPAASRPNGLFKHAQDAVYAMRGRTRLMDDAALTAALILPTHKPLQEEE